MEFFEKLFRVGLKLEKLNKVLISKSELSLVQWYILRNMMENPYCSASNLAERIGCHTSTLTAFINRMKKKKCVAVDTDSVDARRKRLVITRTGREKVLKTDAFLKKSLDDLDVQDMDSAIDGLIERLRNV